MASSAAVRQRGMNLQASRRTWAQRSISAPVSPPLAVTASSLLPTHPPPEVTVEYGISCDFWYLCLSLSDEMVKPLAWTTFVSGIREPELIQYLKERRLYVNEPVQGEEDD